MKLIPPTKVTGQLLALLHEAQEELVIVTPYVNLTYWQKPVVAIKQAIARGVNVAFYIRSGMGQATAQSQAQVAQFGLTPILVEKLHVALYCHEAAGLLTSMNLQHAADTYIEAGSLGPADN